MPPVFIIIRDVDRYWRVVYKGTRHERGYTYPEQAMIKVADIVAANAIRNYDVQIRDERR